MGRNLFCDRIEPFLVSSRLKYPNSNRAQIRKKKTSPLLGHKRSSITAPNEQAAIFFFFWVHASSLTTHNSQTVNQSHGNSEFSFRVQVPLSFVGWAFQMLESVGVWGITSQFPESSQPITYYVLVFWVLGSRHNHIGVNHE